MRCAPLIPVASLFTTLGLFSTPLHAQCEVQALGPTMPANVDVFGWSVDVLGDWIAVGSNGQDDACPMDPNCNSGGVFLFQRTPSGWSVVTQLVPSNSSFRDEFGQDVSLSGDRLLAGAHTRLGGGGAYVFVNDGLGNWSEEQFLIGSDSVDGAHFGHSVALDGDTALVGSMRDSENGSSAGAAYVFERTMTGWVETAKLLANDGAADDLLARSCHIDGDTIFVGCHQSDGVGVDSGAVYVFQRDEMGTPLDPLDDTWPQVQKLTASDAAAGEFFGRSVVVEGDWAVVGGSRNVPTGETEVFGSAYVFQRVLGTWTEVQVLGASDAEADDRFGISVSMEGDRLVVGAHQEDEGGPNAGAAYVFERSMPGASYFEVAKIVGSAPSNASRTADETGVALSGSTLVLGSRFNGSLLPNAGRAFVVEFQEEPIFPTFCFGNGGVSASCTPCPCGNDAPPSSVGGCLNESGGSAVLLPSGIPSAACDSLRFDLTSANPNTFAILSSGATKAPGNAMNPCFGLDSGVLSGSLNGLRCVVQGVLRHGTRPTDAVGDVGALTNGWGPPSGPPGGLIAQGGFVAGQTRHYQVIYRETSFGACSQELNTSQGVTVSMQP